MSFDLHRKVLGAAVAPKVVANRSLKDWWDGVDQPGVGGDAAPAAALARRLRRVAQEDRRLDRQGAGSQGETPVTAADWRCRAELALNFSRFLAAS